MLSFFKKIQNLFDKFEDKIRFNFSRHPVPYSLVAGVFIVLFWKGIEDTASMFPSITGPHLILISVPVLLMTGVFVSFFVTDGVILSGLKKEQKVVQEAEIQIKEEKAEIKQEDILLKKVAEKLDEIDREVHHIEERLDKQK
ncbi:MAG: hypothetical protein PHS53_00215 [Candidatus Pacebacteria bacterium]|nr:hypothetical protein [Candidatus Paceibacterota bacterium]MDD5356560.1 hypothetical protein [Candidatus Paceibacterota bacterium]